MKKYQCTVCGYVYDEEKGCPDQGIAPGTKWEVATKSQYF
jgi:rubredoxin